MDSGRGNTGHSRHLCGAAQRVDDLVRLVAHEATIPIIGTLKQEKKSDISNCDYRRVALHIPMDGDEIKQRLKARGFKQVDLANFLGMAPNKLSKSLSGERQFKVPEMDRVREFLAEPLGDHRATDLGSIPVAGQIAGGNWRLAVKQSSHSIPSPDPSIPARAFALRVTGDSMDLYVDDGGTIIVDPDDRTLFPKKFYAVANAAGETTFKQYQEGPARFVPCSTNSSHGDIAIGSEPFTIIGRIIWRAARM